MGITDTSGHFNTKVARKMLDEYDNDYLQHDRQLAAIATQTCAIIKDAARLYEENDVLYETVGKLSSTLSERIMELESENAKLRELVKYTLLCCERGWPCEECPLCGEQGTSSDVDGREVTYTICKARDVAQGLGIEVDG